MLCGWVWCGMLQYSRGLHAGGRVTSMLLPFAMTMLMGVPMRMAETSARCCSVTSIEEQ